MGRLQHTVLRRSPRTSACNSILEPLEDRRLFSVPAALGGTDRVALDLDSDWKFIRKEVTDAQLSTTSTKKWTDVDLPHTYNATDAADGGDDYYRGGTWYRKDFDLPKKFNGRRVYVGVGAAAIKADVYVNGNYAGSHVGGEAAFNIDVTGYLFKQARNTIAIRVDNTFDTSIPGYIGDFSKFGGLTRGVRLFATSKLAINPTDSGSSGVKISQPDVSSSGATLDIDVSVRNSDKKNAPYTLRTSLVDAAGRVVSSVTNSFSALARKARTFSQTLTISKPHLWNGTADPYLYTAYTQVIQNGLVYDTIPTTVGIRSIRMDGNVLRLNGKVLQLHGVNLHDDKAGVGTAMTAGDRARDVKLLLEMGANAVRFAHTEVDSDFYEQMDRAGILVWTEIPLWRHVTSGATFASNAKMELQELIRQNINHPSIFTWGLFNELDNTSDIRTLVQALNNQAHAEDPTRFTIAASDLPYPAEINAIPDYITFNEYFGWYGDYTLTPEERFAKLSAFIDSQADYRSDGAIAIGEYGAGANTAQHVNDPLDDVPTSDPNQSQFHSEEYQAYLHELSWSAIEHSTTPVWGAFVWEFTDNANDDRDEGGLPGLNDKGLVTYDRSTPKDAFYYYKSQWNSQPVLYLTGKRNTSRADSNAYIKAYSNLGVEVELLVNGHSVGKQLPTGGVVTWRDVPLAAGENDIQVRAVKKGKTYSDASTCELEGSTRPMAIAAAATADDESTKRRKRDDSVSSLTL